MNPGKFERQLALIEHKSPGRSDAWRKRAKAQLLRDTGVEAIGTPGRVMAYRKPNGRTVCVKKRYQDEQRAMEALEHIAAVDDPRKKPIRAYACASCRGWHLTSKSYDENK